VRGGDGAGQAIRDQQRHAVRGLNRERERRIVGDEDVGMR
jgi:hypothetical protein